MPATRKPATIRRCCAGRRWSHHHFLPGGRRRPAQRRVRRRRSRRLPAVREFSAARPESSTPWGGRDGGVRRPARGRRRCSLGRTESAWPSSKRAARRVAAATSYDGSSAALVSNPSASRRRLQDAGVRVFSEHTIDAAAEYLEHLDREAAGELRPADGDTDMSRRHPVILPLRCPPRCVHTARLRGPSRTRRTDCDTATEGGT